MRYSNSEVALARQIMKGQKRKLNLSLPEMELDLRPKPLDREMMSSFFAMILEAEPIPKDPPWYEQAVAEADHGQLWVTGYGWMDKQLWTDLLAKGGTDDPD